MQDRSQEIRKSLITDTYIIMVKKTTLEISKSQTPPSADVQSCNFSAPLIERCVRYISILGKPPRTVRGASSATWDHTLLPAIRHRCTCPALTRSYYSYRQASTRFRIEGWVDLGGWLCTEIVCLSTASHPSGMTASSHLIDLLTFAKLTHLLVQWLLMCPRVVGRSLLHHNRRYRHFLVTLHLCSDKQRGCI